MLFVCSPMIYIYNPSISYIVCILLCILYPGAAFNSVVLAIVTVWVEKRIERNKERLGRDKQNNTYTTYNHIHVSSIGVIHSSVCACVYVCVCVYVCLADWHAYQRTTSP